MSYSFYIGCIAQSIDPQSGGWILSVLGALSDDLYQMCTSLGGLLEDYTIAETR